MDYSVSCFDDLTKTCMCHLASVPTRQLHQLPQCCPSGKKLFSVCGCPAHSTCSKGKWELWFTIIQLYIGPQHSHSIECLPNWLLCVPAAGNLEVCAEVGGVRPRAAESLEGAVGSDCPAAVAAAALHSPRTHGTRRKVQLNRVFIKKNCIWWASVFVSALLPFSERFPVSTSDRCLSAVHPAWPDGSPKTM